MAKQRRALVCTDLLAPLSPAEAAVYETYGRPRSPNQELDAIAAILARYHQGQETVASALNDMQLLKHARDKVQFQEVNGVLE